MQTLQQQLIDKYITDKAVEALLKLQEFKNTGYSGDTLIIIGEMCTGKTSVLNKLKEWHDNNQLIDNNYTFHELSNPDDIKKRWQICTISSYYTDDLEAFDNEQIVWMQSKEDVSVNLTEPQRILKQLESWVKERRKSNADTYKRIGNGETTQKSKDFYFGLYTAFGQALSHIKLLTGEGD